jgi:transaldolase
MGASFRNKGEILELAGCDKLTIAPSLLEELRSSTESFDRRLEPSDSSYVGDKLDVGESTFRFTMNEDAMATEKLAEGIRGFSSDIVRLEAIIGDRLQVNH